MAGQLKPVESRERGNTYRLRRPGGDRVSMQVFKTESGEGKCFVSGPLCRVFSTQPLSTGATCVGGGGGGGGGGLQRKHTSMTNWMGPTKKLRNLRSRFSFSSLQLRVSDRGRLGSIEHWRKHLLHLVETIFPTALDNLFRGETDAGIGLEHLLGDDASTTGGGLFFLLELQRDRLAFFCRSGRPIGAVIAAAPAGLMAAINREVLM